MIPPVDPAVLSSNPKFSALYSDLCNNKLNPDGTSKLDAKARRDRDALTEDLKKARLEAAKKDVIQSGLQELSYAPDELPQDLQQLVAVVAALLDGQIAEEDGYLIQEDLDKFAENIEHINTALSHRLQQDAAALASLLETQQEIYRVNGHDPSEAIEELPTSITNLKDSISTSTARILRLRLDLADEAVRTHDLYRRLISRSINILEQVLHGSAAREAKAQADYLASVADGMAKKLAVQRAQLVAQFYTADVREALDARSRAMAGELRSVKGQLREREGKLEQYRAAGNGMEMLAREYAEILREMEKVRGEVERLRA